VSRGVFEHMFGNVIHSDDADEELSTGADGAGELSVAPPRLSMSGSKARGGRGPHEGGRDPHRGGLHRETGEER